jgi:SCP-2 sterol transfer family
MARLAKLRDFSDNSVVDLRVSLGKVAAELSRGSLACKVAIIVGEDEQNLLLIHLDPPRVEEWSASRETVATKPDFILYANRDTLSAVLRGQLSPLEALLDGRLRYAGNEELGVAILRQLASTQDAIFEPCRDRGP